MGVARDREGQIMGEALGIPAAEFVTVPVSPIAATVDANADGDGQMQSSDGSGGAPVVMVQLAPTPHPSWCCGNNGHTWDRIRPALQRLR